MDNQLTISILNPIWFYDKDRALLPIYNTKYRGDFMDREARLPWQQSSVGEYFQKWENTDIIRLQFMSNVAPITLYLYDCTGRRIGAGLVFDQKQRNRYDPDLFIYELALDLTGIARGRYRIEITIGDPVIETIESDWLDIAEKWPRTVLMEYKSSLPYYGDGIFLTGWAPSFRVEGWFDMDDPASKDVVYQDQSYNTRLQFSEPFQPEIFIIGPVSGVPNWTPEVLNWILGCDELYIDGKAWTKPAGNQLEGSKLEKYAYRGYQVGLLPTNRRASKIFPLNPTTGGKKILVALNVETQGFADTEIGSSSNVVKITSVE
jgi:hypothetical protein